MERYLSFTIDNLRFIDLFQFVNASLDKLASNLHQEDFSHTRLHTPRDKLQLMIRKGVFCYDYWMVRIRQMRINCHRANHSTVG